MKKVIQLVVAAISALFFIYANDVHAQGNSVSGKVCLDANENSELDPDDWGLAAIRIYIYEDLNNNGVIDPGEPVLDSTITNVLGEFTFEGLGQGNYLVTFNAEDLPPDKKLLSNEVFTVSFTSDDGNVVDNLKFGYQGESTVCWGVSDEFESQPRGNEPDALYLMNRFSGTNILIGPTESSGIEAIASKHGELILYTVSNNIFGTLNILTGKFTPFPEPLGEGNGEDGLLSFEDIDGLSFDPFTGILYASVRRDGAKRDLLIQIDINTGKFIPNAFGPGLDYVVIDGPGFLEDIDDIAIDPVTGIMYAISNDSGKNDFLVKIDKTTGKGVVVGQIVAWDMEGLGFTRNGNLYGTTGNKSDNDFNNRLFLINKETGEVDIRGKFYTGEDFESVECHDVEAENCLISVSTTPGQSLCSPVIMNIGHPSNDPNLVYHWSPAATLDDSTSNNPLASPQQTTTYYVTVTDPVNSDCSVKDTVVVAVAGELNADFSFKIECVASNEVQFTDSSYGSVGVTDWFWDFGDGTTSTEQNPVHVYKDIGAYTVTLIVANINGCADTAYHTVTVDEPCEFEVWFPNAFTPDSRGKGLSSNKRAKVRGRGIAEVEIRIFDRWGELVYHADNIEEAMEQGWDGTFQGQPVDMDSYAYYMTAKPDCCKEDEFYEVFMKGSLTLLR